MKTIEQPTRALPQNTILFCKKPWQVPSMILAFLVLLTFVWAGFIMANFKELDFYENAYELSVPEFLFRDMAGSGFQNVSQAVAPGVVGIGATAINMPPVATGALVSPNGHVITALHPLKDLGEIAVFVRTSTGITKYRAEIAKSLPSHDLALLKILTPDRFMYFPLADTANMQPVEGVMGIGFGSNGALITKEGRLFQGNSTLNVGTLQISHLLGTDAIYTWEQTGGPLVSTAGELVGIGLSVMGDNKLVQGYVVPAHVLAADLGDVVTFKVNPAKAPASAPLTNAPMTNAAGTNTPGFVQAAAPNMLGNQGQGNAGMDTAVGTQTGPMGSSSWWTRARAQVVEQNPNMAMNVAAPNSALLQMQAPQMQAQQMPGQMPGQIQAQMQPQSPGGVAGVMGMGFGLTDTDHMGRTRIGGLTVGDVFSLMLLAVVVGVTSGMVTMGGGVLQVAGMMIVFGYGMHLIRPVAYLTNLFIFGAAARRNAKHGLIMWDTVKSVTPWACVGVVGGYFIGNELGDRSIGMLLGVFAALMTLKGLQELLNKNQEEVILRTDGGEVITAESEDGIEDMINLDEDSPAPSHEVMIEQASKAFLGLPPGLISGILGISGGVVSVPMQRIFVGASLHNAIANSSVIVFWASLTGAIVAFAHGVPAGLIDVKAPLTISAIMIPGAYVGGLLGAKLMKMLPAQVLRGVYTAIMAAVAVKMLFLN